MYRGLLRRPQTDLPTLATELALSAEAVDHAVAHLSELGLLWCTPQGALRGSEPQAAVQGLIERRLSGLNRQLRETVEAYRLIDSLLADQADGQRAQPGSVPPRAAATRGGTEPGDPPVERLTGMTEVRARLDELTFFSREGLLATHPGGPVSAESIASGRVRDDRLLQRGLSVRTVFRKDAAADPRTVDYLLELTAKGAEVRVAQSLTERMLVFDRRVALTPIDPRTPPRARWWSASPDWSRRASRSSNGSGRRPPSCASTSRGRRSSRGWPRSSARCWPRCTRWTRTRRGPAGWVSRCARTTGTPRS